MSVIATIRLKISALMIRRPDLAIAETVASDEYVRELESFDCSKVGAFGKETS